MTIAIPTRKKSLAEVARWRTLCAVDFDKWACATYAANFPGVEVRCAKVEDVIDSLPHADVIIAGPPCQDFSRAGKGLGEYGPRNGWPAFVATVARMMPRMFLAENVAGMLDEAHRPYLARVITEHGRYWSRDPIGDANEMIGGGA